MNKIRAENVHINDQKHYLQLQIEGKGALLSDGGLTDYIVELMDQTLPLVHHHPYQSCQPFQNLFSQMVNFLE